MCAQAFIISVEKLDYNKVRNMKLHYSIGNLLVMLSYDSIDVSANGVDNDGKRNRKKAHTHKLNF